MSAYDHSRVQHFIGTFVLARVDSSFIMIQGGNSLEKAPASNVYDFVKANGGHTVITKVCSAFIPRYA